MGTMLHDFSTERYQFKQHELMLKFIDIVCQYSATSNHAGSLGMCAYHNTYIYKNIVTVFSDCRVKSTFNFGFTWLPVDGSKHITFLCILLCIEYLGLLHYSFSHNYGI